jgi:NAD(P)-dependent dehydrogenase (short-subunit alcohol dehydrogenase family)
MLAAKTILVTGSNRGTGRGIARAFRDAGCTILSLNRTLSGEDWLGEVHCDLSSPDSIRDAMSRVRAATDVIDVCVLNAAVRKLGPISTLPAADWMESVATNLVAPFLVTQAALPLMSRPGGIFAYVGSHAGGRFFEGGVAYCSTKAALKALVEVLLLEERRRGIRAMLISPGAISNRDDDESPTKMSPASVGELVARLVLQCPPDIAIGEVELRPANLGEAQSQGIERLQHV